MRGEKGFALILTLIVTALMVAALVEMIHQTYVDVSLSRGYRDGQQASLLAESGIKGGIKLLQLSLPAQATYSSLTDAWAKPVKLDDETGAIEVTVVEESGRLCINDLFQDKGESEPNIPAALKRLGKILLIPEDVWNALADWIDNDDLSRPNGAETPYYQTQKPPYKPYKARNGKLATIAELSLVRGFTPERVAALQPFVTVYPDLPGAALSPVNINTAPEKVLMALDEGIDDLMAKKIADVRRLKPFQSPGELSRVPGCEAISQRLVGKVSVKGNLFRIKSIARVKESSRTVEAVMRLSGEILSWQEY
jgi:general secretion pathway protein K